MDPTAQLKTAAKKTVSQVVQEPLEMLKTAKTQISPDIFKGTKPQSYPVEQGNNTKYEEEEKRLREQSAVRDARQLQALEAEIADIRRQKVFNDLIQRISQGEEVSVEEFFELTSEQRDVLKAQKEAVAQRMTQKQQETQTLVEPPTKRGRQLFNFGQKTQVKREQTKIEKPLPPSG